MAGRGEAEAVARRLVERLWNGHEFDAADEFFAPDFDNGPGRPPGPDFVKAWHRETRESFPDLRYTIDALLVDGSQVALRWTATGTQRGAFGPLPPTGRTATYVGAHFLTVEGGRVTRLWSINDTFGKVLQLGARLLPPEG